MAATPKEYSCPKVAKARVANTSNATCFAVPSTCKKGSCLYVPLPHQLFKPPCVKAHRSDSAMPAVLAFPQSTDLLPGRSKGTRGITPQLRNAVVPAVVPRTARGQGTATPYGACTHPIFTSPKRDSVSIPAL